MNPSVNDFNMDNVPVACNADDKDIHNDIVPKIYSSINLISYSLMFNEFNLPLRAINLFIKKCVRLSILIKVRKDLLPELNKSFGTQLAYNY